MTIRKRSFNVTLTGNLIIAVTKTAFRKTNLAYFRAEYQIILMLLLFIVFFDFRLYVLDVKAKQTGRGHS